MLDPSLATRAVRQATRSVAYSPGQTPSRPSARPAPRAIVQSDPVQAIAAATYATRVAAAAAHLTERELQVLVGMSRGLSNPEIGRTLHIAVDTVKTHVKQLLRKLQARNRAHAVHRGWELQILSGWELGILPSGGAR